VTTKRFVIGSMVVDRLNRNSFVGLVINTKESNADVYSASAHMRGLIGLHEDVLYVFFAERPALSRWMFASEVKNMLPDNTCNT
jgi:hypothetical protein